MQQITYQIDRGDIWDRHIDDDEPMSNDLEMLFQYDRMTPDVLALDRPDEGDYTEQTMPLREFYEDFDGLSEVDPEWLFAADKNILPITAANEAEICEWVRNGKTHLGFHPAVIRVDGQRYLVY